LIKYGEIRIVVFADVRKSIGMQFEWATLILKTNYTWDSIIEGVQGCKCKAWENIIEIEWSSSFGEGDVKLQCFESIQGVRTFLILFRKNDSTAKHDHQDINSALLRRLNFMQIP
jgi:hypothetical protein